MSTHKARLLIVRDPTCRLLSKTCCLQINVLHVHTEYIYDSDAVLFQHFQFSKVSCCSLRWQASYFLFSLSHGP